MKVGERNEGGERGGRTKKWDIGCGRTFIWSKRLWQYNLLHSSQHSTPQIDNINFPPQIPILDIDNIIYIFHRYVHALCCLFRRHSAAYKSFANCFLIFAHFDNIPVRVILLPSVLSILQMLSSPSDFQRISEFQEADSGQGLLFHVGGYLCPVAFLPYIAFLIQLSRCCSERSWSEAVHD